MSALNPNRRGASPGRPEHLYPGAWAYVFISSRANRAAELSLGRADGASAPTRGGLACRAACEGKMGPSIAGKLPTLLSLRGVWPYARVPLFWESVAYGTQTPVMSTAQVLARSAEVSY
jgi:hypothetical protein